MCYKVTNSISFEKRKIFLFGVQKQRHSFTIVASTKTRGENPSKANKSIVNITKDIEALRHKLETATSNTPSFHANAYQPKETGNWIIIAAGTINCSNQNTKAF